MTESFENYLKTILILQRRRGHVLCADVANELGYSRASVTIAVKKLREHGYLTPSGRLLVLTDSGRQLAERTFERHEVFAQMLATAGVDAHTAEADACRLEHAISDESFAALKACMAQHGMAVWPQRESV